MRWSQNPKMNHQFKFALNSYISTFSKEVYIIFVIAILTPYSYFERDGNCMKLLQHSQSTCGNTPTNFRDDVTVILENHKIRVFQKC